MIKILLILLVFVYGNMSIVLHHTENVHQAIFHDESIGILQALVASLHLQFDARAGPAGHLFYREWRDRIVLDGVWSNIRACKILKTAL